MPAILGGVAGSCRNSAAPNIVAAGLERDDASAPREAGTVSGRP